VALGDGIRRNIADVDPSERTALKDAIIEMHHRFYPGTRGETPPGGVSWWFKQDEIHQATHVHRGPEFVPWHRELTNRFEELLRQINPQLSLHYWDFKQDPRNIPTGNTGGGMTGTLSLFDSNLMGSSSGEAGDPWLAAGFYDPKAGSPDHPQDRDLSNNPVDPPKTIQRTRAPAAPGASPTPYITAAEEDALFSNGDFHSFRIALESIHNGAHVYFSNVSPHISFRDPFVFLLHSNVDRLYAKWQTDPNHPERLDPALVYGAESNVDETIPDGFGGTTVQNLTHLVEPWSTGAGHFHAIRPWEPTHEHLGVPHDYHDVSVVAPRRYDTNPQKQLSGVGILWHNSSTGEIQIWFMDSNRVASRATVLGEDGNPTFIGPPFSIVGTSDFNGDGKADILWYNSFTGEIQIWFMDSNRVASRATVLGEDGNPTFIGPPFSIVGAGVFGR
jgi:hypothetical protein